MDNNCTQGYKAKRTAHMQRRRGHDLKYKDLGDEFGVSKSTAYRILNPAQKGKSMAKPSNGTQKTAPPPKEKPLGKVANSRKVENVKTDRGDFRFKKNKDDE